MADGGRDSDGRFDVVVAGSGATDLCAALTAAVAGDEQTFLSLVYVGE
jgi:succinate dehydrogenase/fumarate reductase flavoprotein subunit